MKIDYEYEIPNHICDIIQLFSGIDLSNVESCLFPKYG